MGLIFFAPNHTFIFTIDSQPTFFFPPADLAVKLGSVGDRECVLESKASEVVCSTSAIKVIRADRLSNKMGNETRDARENRRAGVSAWYCLP